MIDISNIDFDILQKTFAKKENKHLMLRDLEETVKHKVDALMRTNPNRVNFYERYEQIIKEYNENHDKAAIEKTFMDLMELVKNLDQEEKRYLREGFDNDEQLAMYDLLTKESLERKDIEAIKKVAKELLALIKDKIAMLDHWADKDETRSQIVVLIRDTLWMGLPESYSPELVQQKGHNVFEYVYNRYRA